MTGQIPLRMRIGLVFAFVLVFAWNMRSALDRMRRGLPSPADSIVSQYDRRFVGVREALPARGVVGYATDVPPERVFDDGKHAFPFYMAQYAVAPLFLKNSPSLEYVLGNFHTRAARDEFLRGGRFAVIKDLGNGVMVLRRKVR